MSRIGKQPVQIPDEGDGDRSTVRNVTVKGPKGELKHTVHPNIAVKQEDGVLLVDALRTTSARTARCMAWSARCWRIWSPACRLAFKRRCLIEGVGYGSDLRGTDLVMKLGYSHEIVVNPPPNISFEIEDRGRVIHIKGIDKQVVGQVAANIRELRPPEPYLGKGMRYSDEIIRRKAGKTGK